MERKKKILRRSEGREAERKRTILRRSEGREVERKKKILRGSEGGEAGRRHLGATAGAICAGCTACVSLQLQ